MLTSSRFWLFLGPSLIWGFTWFAITFQIKDIAPLVSVFYRFLIATAVIYAFCKYRGYGLHFDLKTNLLLAFLGLSNFSLNYWLVYLAELHITSGLVAVIFGLLLFFNMLFARIFLGDPLKKRVFIAGVIGIAGTTLIFRDELFLKYSQGFNWLALSYVLMSLVLASLGNIAAARLGQKKLNVVQINTVGMIYGTLILYFLLLIRGEEYKIPTSIEFWASLLYLAIFGSVIAFNLYLNLIMKVGPDRAAYTQIIIPIVAMLASTFLEDYQWSWWSASGVLLVISGNAWLFLKPKS